MQISMPISNAYPLLHADRIVTPTLFLCGDRDFNVPLLNSEQMYQAMSRGIDAHLVIYPGEYHGLRHRATCGTGCTVSRLVR